MLAAVIVAEIGDIRRFRHPGQLGCWAGLTPRHRESDAKVTRGHISKMVCAGGMVPLRRPEVCDGGGWRIGFAQGSADVRLCRYRGESWRGRICPADRESLRGWLRRFHGVPDVEFAVEGCTGWRYVVEELQRAGITAHLAEPAETAGLRGRKRRAKTDWADARHLRDLLLDGRIPESWIPPAQVLEARALVRLYKDLLEERTSWQQRVHATLFHQGIPVVPKLGTADGQQRLDAAELSAAGRRAVQAGLRQTSG